MNPLQSSLIEKVDNDCGFEHAVSSNAEEVMFASARYPTLNFCGSDRR